MKKRYWLKGGVTGAILSIFLFFLLFSSFSDKVIPDTFIGTLDNIYLIIYFPIFVFLMFARMDNLEGTNPALFSLTHYALIAIYGFLIGIVIGWLYGKISTRGGSAFGGKNSDSSISTTNY